MTLFPKRIPTSYLFQWVEKITNPTKKENLENALYIWGVYVDEKREL